MTTLPKELSLYSAPDLITTMSLSICDHSLLHVAHYFCTAL